MKNSALSVAVMSGKGGVGKSNLALNLGYALSQGDHPVLLMDCDLGLANLDVLLGITPEGNLQDVILKDTGVSDIIYPLSGKIGRFDILPAASGVPELAEMDKNLRDMLIRRLEPELGKYDYVMLDLGAGIHNTVQTFAAMAAVRLMILTPEPTSLTDAYALMKVLHADQGIREFWVIVNEVSSPQEEKATFQRLHKACEHFLGFAPKYLGSVKYDPKVSEAVRKQQPLLKVFPTSPAAKDITALARKLEQVKLGKMENLLNQPVLRYLPN